MVTGVVTDANGLGLSPMACSDCKICWLEDLMISRSASEPLPLTGRSEVNISDADLGAADWDVEFDAQPKSTNGKIHAMG